MYINSHHKKGMELLIKEQLEEALQELSLALEENPGHPDIISDRGVLYIHLKKKDEALSDFDLSLELQPENGYRYSSRAYAKEFFGDLDGAILDYEQAVLLDKEDAVAYNNLGLLLEKKGRQEQAKRHFDRADALAKQEANLLHVVEELEHQSDAEILADESIQANTEKKEEPRTSIPPIETRKKQGEAWNEMKKIFTSKEQFQAFLQFIKNGFKNK